MIIYTLIYIFETYPHNNNLINGGYKNVEIYCFILKFSNFIVENNYNNTARVFLSVNECRTNCFVDCLIQDDSYIIDKISSNFNDAYNCLKKKDFKLPIISQELIDSYECDYSELFYFYENDCFTPILYTENYKTQTLAVYDLNSGVELPNPEHYYLAEDLYE